MNYVSSESLSGKGLFDKLDVAKTKPAKKIVI